MRALNIVSAILVIVGAVNWGLVGLFQFDLVAALFGGQGATLSRLVYILVGIAGLVQLAMLTRGMSDSSSATPQYATRTSR